MYKRHQWLDDARKCAPAFGVALAPDFWDFVVLRSEHGFITQVCQQNKATLARMTRHATNPNFHTLLYDPHPMLFS